MVVDLNAAAIVHLHADLTQAQVLCESVTLHTRVAAAEVMEADAPQCRACGPRPRGPHPPPSIQMSYMRHRRKQR